MTDVAQEPLIVFLHIPKTAGLTVRICVLPRQYTADETFASKWAGEVAADGAHAVGGFADEFGSVGLFDGVVKPGVVWFPESLAAAAARFHQLPAEQRARIHLFYSEHTEFGLHEYLSRPVSYFTLLREPAARVLSHYGFSAGHCAPEAVDLSGRIAAHVEANLQTRLLAGPYAQTASLSPVERLERAKRNLRACAVVGLTERFDETMLLLKKAYGWRMPFYERRNISKHRLSRKDLPAETLRQIEADNALDVALYAYAQELFAAQLRQYGPTLSRDVRLFRALNWLWQRRQAAQNQRQKTATLLEKRLITPAYEALSRWGGLRRILPAHLTPRVAASVEDNRLYFDLLLGKRRIGYFNPQQQCWEIQRPFHLLVDEAGLPGHTSSRLKTQE